ncbi:ATP-dependent DNA helicase [Pleurotus eryngii]|uniref:ATP-dependent DNA helicase n=1 Tax=Pleurotus eryngii TaxID=5323 RepID=A0A9P5ZTX4_PLEER|nr:ATP-dependent DNA helicase [Pleurotus eryngii]
MGKSLCFQIPAIAVNRGVTIVVSPLLALMKNQVNQLRQKNIQVCAYNSDISDDEKKEIEADLLSGHSGLRLLYVTPERLCTSVFRNILAALYRTSGINRLVVDEAHCVSEWGHDFREDYRRMGPLFRQCFSQVPITALTATATPSVQVDIIRSLRMSEKNMFKAIHPFNRANLFYEVRYSSAPDSVSQMEAIAEYIHTLYRRRGRPSSGIVYCRARNTCDEIASHLRRRAINARPYHARIGRDTLAKTLSEWEVGGNGEGGVDVVCATIAFGMGIDKGDVRYIIHYDLPKSFEGYYQETGRAGRDGQPAKCILYYSREDAMRARKFVSDSYATRVAKISDGPEPSQRSTGSLESLIRYAENTTTCRHTSICNYFGEMISDSDPGVAKQYCDRMCDVCKYPGKTRQRKILTAELQSAVIAPIVKATPRPESLWRTKLRDDDKDEAFRPSVKRNLDESSNELPKKQRFEPPPPLVTKPFQSAYRLNKPYKPPFKVPTKEQENFLPTVPERLPSPRISTPHQLPEVNEVVDISDEGTGRASPPLNMVDIEVELDASFSTKIQVIMREETYGRLYGALQRIFVTRDRNSIWTKLSKKPVSAAVRNDVLNRSARKLEFSAHSLSSTEDGYKRRVASLLQILSALEDPRLWSNSSNDKDEDDEVQEVIDILQACCGCVAA